MNDVRSMNKQFCPVNTQIVSVNTNSEAIIQNVPDQLAPAIPRDRVVGFTGSSNVVTTLNKKKWKGEQVRRAQQ